MSDDLHHNCGVAAMYLLDKPMAPEGTASASVHDNDVTPLLPSMLLDIQNRGQLAAGMTTYDPDRQQVLDVYAITAGSGSGLPSRTTGSLQTTRR